jgi:hypothetical protein
LACARVLLWLLLLLLLLPKLKLGLRRLQAEGNCNWEKRTEGVDHDREFRWKLRMDVGERIRKTAEDDTGSGREGEEKNREGRMELAGLA